MCHLSHVMCLYILFQYTRMESSRLHLSWLPGLRVEDRDKQLQIQEVASFHSCHQRLNTKWSFRVKLFLLQVQLAMQLECQRMPFKELKTYNANGPKMSKAKLAHDFLSGVMRTSSCKPRCKFKFHAPPTTKCRGSHKKDTKV